MAKPTIRRITIVHPNGRKQVEAYGDSAHDQKAALDLCMEVRDGELQVSTFKCVMSDGTVR